MLRFGWTVLLLAACARSDAARPTAQAAGAVAADTAHPWRKPGDKVDSILPMEEYLRRFRGGLAEPGSLTGGATSPERLARRFLAAVTARDTAALGTLLVSRAEFAWLVFPNHIYHDPPYELNPEIFWMRLTMGSSKGLGRTLKRYGGIPLTLLRFACQPDPLQARPGPVRFWGGCDLHYRTGERVETGRLFGSMVERDGRAKFLSYANGF